MSEVYLVECEMDIDGGGTTAWISIACFKNYNKAEKCLQKLKKLISELTKTREYFYLHDVKVSCMKIYTGRIEFEFEPSEDPIWGNLITKVYVGVKKKQESGINITGESEAPYGETENK